MRGRILDYDPVKETGLLLGADDQRYSFSGLDWREEAPPVKGSLVDFEAEGQAAKAIYAIGGSPVPQKHTSSNNSVAWGIAGVVTLIISLGFGITAILSFIFGVIAAAEGKKGNDQMGLTLGRISWIGSLVLMLFYLAILLLFGVWALFAFAVNSDWISADLTAALRAA